MRNNHIVPYIITKDRDDNFATPKPSHLEAPFCSTKVCEGLWAILIAFLWPSVPELDRPIDNPPVISSKLRSKDDASAVYRAYEKITKR